MAEKVQPIHTFLYQLVFSIPVLLMLSYLLEPYWIREINKVILASIFYQSVLVAFFSLLIWFRLIHKYPIGRLSVFTFLGPIFGVLLGTLFLGEKFTISIMIGLPMICLGIFLVNWKKTASRV